VDHHGADHGIVGPRDVRIREFTRVLVDEPVGPVFGQEAGQGKQSERRVGRPAADEAKRMPEAPECGRSSWFDEKDLHVGVQSEKVMGRCRRRDISYLLRQVVDHTSIFLDAI
jgi:hypothetical protein